MVVPEQITADTYPAVYLPLPPWISHYPWRTHRVWILIQKKTFHNQC